MITFAVICARFTQLHPDDLRRWIAEGYIRPEPAADEWLFEEIDVERVRLILELRDGMRVNEDALPVILSLLDQLYALRRRMKRLGLPSDDGPDGP
jgi:chaperone modulatory protein CbpM